MSTYIFGLFLFIIFFLEHRACSANYPGFYNTDGIGIAIFMCNKGILVIPGDSERSHDKLTSTNADGEMTLLGFADTRAKGMMSSLATAVGDRSKYCKINNSCSRTWITN